MAERPTSARQIFEAMPGLFLPEKAGDLQASIQFDLTGDGGGKWVVSVANRQIQVTEGTTASPTMSMTAAAADYVAIVNGELNPMTAFMQGKVRVSGDMSLAMKMQSWFAGP